MDSSKSSDLIKTISIYDRIKEEQQAQGFAVSHNLPYINLVNYPFLADILKIIPESVARQFQIIPFMKINQTVRLGCLNPFADGLGEAITKLGTEQGLTFQPFICSATSINYGLDHYAKLITAKNLAASTNNSTSFSYQVNSLKELQTIIGKIPTTESLDAIINGAVTLGASDIHFEPLEDDTQVRFRIDGRLISALSIPEKTYLAIAARIKNTAKIKLDQRKLPQDGRYTLTIQGEEIDIRVSSIPSTFGETIVLRLLTEKDLLSLDQIGMDEACQDAILKAIIKPEGLVLFTGPTGSGKTTSLYAVLQILNQPEKKVITIEDPVEYRFEGLEQVQINTSQGFDFPDALRAILRQDPDTVMVGEIRDKETAEIAVNASLTGHLVLSTLHTNSASSAFVRLLQMGVPKYLIADAISLVVAQRLVRRICSNCGGQGCDNCNNTGFRGRVLIAEFITPDQEITELIKNEATLTDFDRSFKAKGYKSMLDDGLGKVRLGLTTEKEVRSVTD